MPARPHPQARWMRGQHGIGHVNTHGDVMTMGVPQQPDLAIARAQAPADAYAHFVITPGGHVDARMTGPMGSTEFYRLVQQAHPEMAPRWTQSEVPRHQGAIDDDEYDPADEQSSWEEQARKDQERDEIRDGLEGIMPQWQEIMRARGVNEPDWEPLQRVMPEPYLRDWMFMGYSKNGIRDYKHNATRRYLHLMPHNEMSDPAHPFHHGWRQLVQNGKLDSYAKNGVIAFGYRGFIRMQHAIDHAYQDVDQLGGTHPFRDPPDTPRMARWQTRVSEQWWEDEDDHGNPLVRCKHCGELTNNGNPECSHCGEPLTPSKWFSCPSCGSPRTLAGCGNCKDDTDVTFPTGWTGEDSEPELPTPAFKREDIMWHPVEGQPDPTENDPRWIEHRTLFSPGDRLMHQPHREGGEEEPNSVPHGEAYPVIYQHPDPNYMWAHHVHNPATKQTEWVMARDLTPMDDFNDLPEAPSPPGHTGAVRSRWAEAPVRARGALPGPPGALQAPQAGSEQQRVGVYESDPTGKRVWNDRNHDWSDLNTHNGIGDFDAFEAGVRTLVREIGQGIANEDTVTSMVLSMLGYKPPGSVDRKTLVSAVMNALKFVSQSDRAGDEGSPPIYKPGITDAPRFTEEAAETFPELPKGMSDKIPGWGKFPGYVGDPHFPARMRWTSIQRMAIVNVQPAQVLAYVAQALGGTVHGNVVVTPDGGKVFLDIDVYSGNDIIINEIQAVPKGTGLGTQAVNAIRALADTEGAYITIAGAVNSGFWNRFDWLDTSRGKYEYSPPPRTGAVTAEYRMEHSAPGPGRGWPAHVLDQDAPDIYEHPEYYWNPYEPYHRDAWRQLRSLRGKPDAMVTIHRATPARVINPGDWVTPAKSYAEQHARHYEDPAKDMPVVSMKVPARHLWWDGNDMAEFGYYPDESAKIGGIDQWTEDYDPRENEPATCPRCSEPYEHPRERLYGCQQCGYMRGRDMHPQRDHEYFWSRGKPDPLLGELKSMPWLSLLEPRQGAGWTAATAVPLWEEEIRESRFPDAPRSPASMPGPSLVDSDHKPGTCPSCGWRGSPVYGLCPTCGHEYASAGSAWGYSAGTLEPAHPEDVLPPHAEELLHFLRGVSPVDTDVVSPVDTKLPQVSPPSVFEADPSYDDDNPSTPDPSPGALTR